MKMKKINKNNKNNVKVKVFKEVKNHLILK